ncbi:MAG: hypothetical protein ABIG44_06505 [Planctomycetota bacterium]
MSAVVILTPVVIASWPVLTAAVTGAVAAMGFSARGADLHEEEVVMEDNSVETEIEESEVVAEGTIPGQKIVAQRGDIRIEFGQDERGRCTVCVSGEKHTKRELRKIADEVSGRVVQQFVYNKLLTELKQRDYTIVEQERLADESVRVRVKL